MFPHPGLPHEWERLEVELYLGREPEAALATAALQDADPAFRAHALQKAVHALAIALLGLERSLHRTAVVYRTRVARIWIPLLSLLNVCPRPCHLTWLLLQSRPGSSSHSSQLSNQYDRHPGVSLFSPLTAQPKASLPLPSIVTDWLSDLILVAARSLWTIQSGLFHRHMEGHLVRKRSSVERAPAIRALNASETGRLRRA